MYIIDNVVITDSVLDAHFACKLSACKGACCVEGDSGAPLSNQEAAYLEDNYKAIAPYLTEKGKAAISQLGTSVIGEDGELETPLVQGKECAYTVFENGVAFCGVEKAYQAGAIDFQKPISCHLYPIRITQKEGLEYLHYHQWNICQPACNNGRAKKIELIQFLKVALIRKYGAEFYETLEQLSQINADFNQ